MTPKKQAMEKFRMYKLRNMPPCIHKVLKEKQAEIKAKTGRYHSLEYVIYRIIREHTGMNKP